MRRVLKLSTGMEIKYQKGALRDSSVLLHGLDREVQRVCSGVRLR